MNPILALSALALAATILLLIVLGRLWLVIPTSDPFADDLPNGDELAASAEMMRTFHSGPSDIERQRNLG